MNKALMMLLSLSAVSVQAATYAAPTLLPQYDFQKAATALRSLSPDAQAAFQQLTNIDLSAFEKDPAAYGRQLAAAEAEKIKKEQKIITDKFNAASEVVKGDDAHQQALLKKVNSASNNVTSFVQSILPELTDGLTAEGATKRTDQIAKKVFKLLATDFSKVRNKRQFLQAQNRFCDNLDSFLFREFGIDLQGKAFAVFKRSVKEFLSVLIGKGNFEEVQNQLKENFIAPLTKEITAIKDAIKAAETAKNEPLVKDLQAKLKGLEKNLKSIEGIAKVYTQLKNFKKFVGTPKSIAALIKKLNFKIQEFTPAALEDMKKKREAEVTAAKAFLEKFDNMHKTIPAYIKKLKEENEEIQKKLDDMHKVLADDVGADLMELINKRGIEGAINDDVAAFPNPLSLDGVLVALEGFATKKEVHNVDEIISFEDFGALLKKFENNDELMEFYNRIKDKRDLNNQDPERYEAKCLQDIESNEKEIAKYIQTLADLKKELSASTN